MIPEVISHFTIDEPPTKYVVKYKRPKKDEETGKIITEKVYYLNANIFYGNNVHWSIQYEIINFAKDWLLPFFMEIPKILKCKIEFIYYHPSDTWDLDNKDAFWRKVLLDILKTPTENQKAKAAREKRRIRTVEKLPDDTVRFVNGFKCDYELGAHRLEIKIIGFKLDEQIGLF